MIASAQNLDELDGPALREQVRGLMAALGEKEQALAEHQQLLAQQEQVLVTKHQEILYKDTKIAQLTHEIAGLRRYQFGKKGEQVSGVQGSPCWKRRWPPISPRSSWSWDSCAVCNPLTRHASNPNVPPYRWSYRA